MTRRAPPAPGARGARRRRAKITTTLPLWALTTLLALSAHAVEDRAARLERLEKAIEERRARVAAFETEQRGLLDALEAADRAIAAAADETAHNEREVAAAGDAERTAAARLPALEETLARTRAAMAGRVVALYKTGELGPAQLLFAAQSLRELLERVRALSLLLEHDRLLVSRARTEQADLDAARREAVATGERARRALAELGARRSELATERAEKQRLLARVRGDRARESAALGELEEAARALEEALAELGEAPAPLPDLPAGPSFASLRGRLPAPVDAPIVRGFGRQVDEQFLTEVFHKGVDFGATRGSEVRAVAAGIVRFAGWFRGYGRMVILDHGERFFTVHGHLDELRVEVGDVVEAGRVLGTVGDTGSLTGPRLYFEVREGGQAVDPRRWLRAAPGPRAELGAAARRAAAAC
ncbi:MAG: peptidoglycan DD-metalloendopeptidase family protein [Deltaproteobacteria bacterium]|nr:peptidoglycan DD-metalloendopeptidase family protein [Deltaproteobacteria bacterium]